MCNLSTAPFPFFTENGIDLIWKDAVWNWAKRSKALEIAQKYVALFDVIPVRNAKLFNGRNGVDIDGRSVHVI